MRKFNMNSFGPTFAIATEKFLASGRSQLEIKCPSVGAAINIRMRFNQFWKTLPLLPIEQVPVGLRDYLVNGIGDLCTLTKKDDPFIVILATRDQRKLDKAILSALEGLDSPGTPLPLQIELPPAQAEEDPMERALREAGMLPKESA